MFFRLYINMKEILNFDDESLTYEDKIDETALKSFGIKYIFPWQRMVISNILDAAENSVLNLKEEELKDSINRQIVLLPTGAGKSLCFQLPSILLPGKTLVIYPLLALMKDMYKYAKYEVGEATENGDGYTVKVTVYPIAAVSDAAREDYPAFAEGAAQRLVDDEFEKDGQNFEDWWAQSISDMVRVRLSAKEYLDPVEVSVEISKNDSGAYILSSEALAEIDRHIVSYPAD